MALATLVGEAIEPYLEPERGDHARLDGPPLAVNQRTSEQLSLVLYELATNASKYGALSALTGRLAVAWQVDARGALVMTWRESGGPPVDPETGTGFGIKLIAGMLGRGNFRPEFPESGFACTLVLDPDTWEATAAAVPPAP